MSLSTIALLCAGGALGAVLRYWCTRLAAVIYPKLQFPLPTLFVNLTGSLVLGVVFGLLSPDPTAPLEAPLLLFFGVGFCGAYTTFSSFCVDTISLAGTSWNWALLYVLITLGGSIGAFWLPFSIL